MAKATQQELETAKAKAVKGGMPQEVADKVIQMAGSKGEFAMQLNKQKNNSTDNFSYKDATMMMQSALYNPGHGGDPGHTHNNDGSNKIPTVTVEKSSSSTNVDGGSSNNSSYVKTPFSSDPEERAEQKEWIKNNPEKYKELIDAKKNKSSNNVSNESSSSSKNITLSNKSESDILNEQKSVTNTNQSMIEGIDDLAKINRTNDSINIRNKYISTFDFPKFKKANTPGTDEYNDANQVASAYAAGRQRNSGYTDLTDAMSRSVDSEGNNLFPAPSSYINAVKRGRYAMEGGRLPSRVSLDNAAHYTGKSWDVQKTMESLRKEQSNLPLNMAPLKFYGRKNKK